MLAQLDRQWGCSLRLPRDLTLLMPVLLAEGKIAAAELTPEGAKFWLSCLTDLQNRGLRDIFVACIDGLSGFREAIHAAYPQTKVQLCIVHLVRAALRYVSTQDSHDVARDLKKIYQSATVLEAETALQEFAQTWDAKYPTIAKQWRAKWSDIITLFEFPPPIRKATTPPMRSSR
jgi:putative transposase